ncbi:FAD-dependent monooxygenase [Actinomadura fibrosa]|uniref:FAD-dependent monooxygenase n=1 Tax=Actinomadura fibrosa TaxID=111802 RepID=A0ABW2XFJ0_9ACTN|nr:FAD-dependent monooxygenase [Actinomadura fibrosa]
MDTDVIIVGAGPTGLTLAGELRLGGAEVIVLERMTERGWQSRGIGFTARATEMFHQRGLLDRLENPETTTRGHFGGIPIDYGILEGAHFGVRNAPQYRIEEMLETRARELGASVRRGYELTGLDDTGDGVTATVRGPDGTEQVSARYLVGCDGGRSTVRRLAGFTFAGSDATREMYLADVRGCDIKPRRIGELSPRGMVMAAPLEEGYTRIIVCENGNRPDPGEQVTFTGRQVGFTELADAWQRMTGDSIHHGEARWVSSFTDATRQATEYRRGRVLLAGDAAHIHLPAGGQGLSVGAQDAFNLGWKLAATVTGRAPEGLLDTYESERHPVGARVLLNTLAQGTLNLNDSSVEPLRTVMAEIIAIPAAARHLIGMVSGFDVRYDMGVPDGHPLLGGRMPDRALELADGGRDQVARLLHAARGVLITADASGAAARTAAGWSDRVDIVRVRSFPSVPEACGAATESVLLRPDGYVAWVAPDGGDLGDALRRWFGAPVPASPVRRTEHAIDVDAPAEQVYALIADVGRWPEVFPPTVDAECVERDGNSELIRLWATANGTAKTWTSRREHDPERMSVTFRQQRSQHPVGGMGGEWVVEPVSASACRARLLHDFFAATGDPADLDWISEAVDRNSMSELRALKASAEQDGPDRLVTFDDTVTVHGRAEDVYGFLNEAQLWSERLPHVARVSLEEETPGLQILEMDTRTKDGSVHTTRSVRVCRPHTSIVYKQIVLPALLTLHTGRWLIEPADGGGVTVTSRHTVRINAERITEVLGDGADMRAAQEFVRNALSGNSLATLRLAKAHAEGLAEGLAAKRAARPAEAHAER